MSGNAVSAARQPEYWHRNLKDAAMGGGSVSLSGHSASAWISLQPPRSSRRRQGLSTTGFQPRGQESHRICALRYVIQEENMRLNAPKQVTWFIALILGVLGLLGALITIPVLSTLAFWLVFVGLVLMLLATYLVGL
jgi:hypothetical protein